MKILLMAALLSFPARAAETKMPPAVAAGRFYATAKVVNVLLSNQRKNAESGLKYGEDSRFRAMYHTAMNYIDLDTAGKELTAAAAALPAKPSPDAAAKALLLLADQELAQAEKTAAGTTAMVDSAQAKIAQNYETAPPAEKGGSMSVNMMLMMLKPRPVPIAQARAAAAGKR